MKLLKILNYFIYPLLLIAILSFFFIPAQKLSAQSLPSPDPLNVQGDELYSIYRKGLITRHITSNGRLLYTIALESIDDFTPESYDGNGYNGYIKYTSDGTIRRLSINRNWCPPNIIFAQCQALLKDINTTSSSVTGISKKSISNHKNN